VSDAAKPESGPSSASAGGPGRQGLLANRWKLGALVALGLLGLVLVIQNSGNAEVGLLWWSVRMPLFFLLLAMVALGVGLDRAWQWRRRRR
jgi:uncharacterized integral membrane protein